MQKRGLNNSQGITGKKGQLAIFVIIGIVIILAVAFIFLIRNQLTSDIQQPDTATTQISLQFEEGMRECVRSSAVDTIKEVGKTLGNPDLRFVEVEDERYYVVCDSNLDYSERPGVTYGRCVNQIPDLKGHLEDKIENKLAGSTWGCIEEILDAARSDGYAVTPAQLPTVTVEINQRRVDILYTQLVSISRGNSNLELGRISVSLESEMHSLIMKANEIVNDEIGRDQDTGYFNYASDYLEYTLLGITFHSGNIDGDKWFELQDRSGKDTLRFAVRQSTPFTR